ncbi:hypothetical protein [Burkholderia pyrrocinia]|uniref:hypothetical protein n=1 Tax=Burkholderia pyrrocinia TaxID=60550 RepID=UPI00158E5BBF|nr:hypothetical protein [Burkholderia pyrrocinia]
MNDFPKIDYQKQLILAGLDDFYPNAALPHVLGGQFGSSPDLWRQAVIDFLCINVGVGMLECVHRKEVSGEKGAILLRELLISGDKENKIDVEVLWNSLYFSATVNLDRMLKEFELNNWDAFNFDVNCQFIESLGKIYERQVE